MLIWRHEAVAGAVSRRSKRKQLKHMSRQFRPLSWSIPVGTWAGTRVALSVWFVLVAVVLCLQLESPWLGMLATGVLCVSVLLRNSLSTDGGSLSVTRCVTAFGPMHTLP